MGNTALNLAKRRGFPAMLLHVHLCTIPPNHEKPTCYRTNKLHQIYIYLKKEKERSMATLEPHNMNSEPICHFN